MEQTLRIDSGNVTLAASLHLPQNQGAKVPLVIICHGFVGSRIGVNRLFVKAAREFVQHGIAVLRFDYEGCGESEGDYGSYGFERFIQQTLDVIDYSTKLDEVDENQIILLGHSLGGAVAALTASRDKRIQKLAMWSAVGHPFHDIVQIIGEGQFHKSATTHSIDHEGFALTHRFLESLQGYSPIEESKQFSGDVFLAHGMNDEVIPADYCSIYQYSFIRGKSKSCVKILIPEADHTYSSIQASTSLYRQTLQWLVKQIHTQQVNDHEAI
ncbi:alpha/beta hydrolase [Ammoniphilus sp. YIM 78166]|uniref:alpha/beta hydrolase n=1 Tax=Ammoniphilus sp. YIM 78166 TaxID=1644106 RepID=UPI00106F7F2C|nr:alpha/beta fold hydrolase [Ammoniphilus sp. YIM 78166]